MSERIKIGYLGGGSRGWAHKLINDLAQCETLEGKVTLYDLNYDDAERNARFGNWVQSLDGAVGEWTYEATDQREHALENADFVFLSTQDPPDDTMRYDLELPEEYGIYQPVGDTTGPGGIVRAMRTIPTYRDFARAIRQHCPDAWVINYTNPMTLCTRTLYEEFPEIKAMGCCHEVFNTQHKLASLVSEYYDAEEPARDEIEINVKGINHFTWIDEARWRGQDILDLVDRHIEETDLPQYDPGDLESESYYNDDFLITYELYRRFGVLPAAGDRHLAEFVPWFLAVDEPEEVHQWGIRLTPVEFRVDKWETGHDKFERQMSGEEEFEFYDTGEETIAILRALVGQEDLKTNLNLPNHGQMPMLPDDAVVETNALLTEDNITPLQAGTLPKGVHNLVSTQVLNQETLLEAGFAEDPELAFQAFLNDPLVNIQANDAQNLFAEMVDATREYLDSWDLDDRAILQENPA